MPPTAHADASGDKQASAKWRRANVADVSWTGAILNDPAFFSVLGAISADTLQDALTSTKDHLLIWSDGAVPQAFALLSGCDGPVVKVEEFVVVSPGGGIGFRSLGALVADLARSGAHHRVWLHVVTDNHRAIRLYRKLGFGEDELIKSGWLNRNGQTVDILRLHLSLS